MKVLAVVVLALALSLVCSVADAAEIPFKQGAVYLLNDRQVKNFSCVEVAKTKSVETWNKWLNMLYDGWSLDVGMSYDGAGIKGAALLLGRDLGKLGDYIPMDFPLDDKINITLYPIGVAIEDPFDHPQAELAVGMSLLKLGVKF